MQNNRRYDLSNRLTHFFRLLDLDDGSSPHIPESWGLSNVDEHTVFSPLFLIRCAIRHGHLWATWSLRKGVRTIYGPHPAICFTDMPTAAFLEASAARLRKKQKISTYALTFQKSQMFAAGARPVIYGLSAPTHRIPSGNDDSARIIPEDLLPLHEQYRYVTYMPTGDRWKIDWTHEREWRWRMTDDAWLAKFEAEIEESGIVTAVNDIPGLDLYASTFRHIGVIVNTSEEAKKIFHDILVLVDRKVITPDTFEYVLVSDEIPEPEKVRDPDEEADAIAAATIDISTYLTPLPERDKEIANKVQALVAQVNAEAPPPEPGKPGGCWLWILDNVHDVTRALVNTGHVLVNHEGKYLLNLNAFSRKRGLRQREGMAKQLGLLFRRTLGVDAGYFSVLDSDNPDDVPYYNDDFLDNHLFYNFWSDGL